MSSSTPIRNRWVRPLAILALLVLTCSAFAALVVLPAPAGAASGPLLHDDFTRDTSLNASLWQVSGPVGSVLGPDDAGFNPVTLVPAFSSSGMEIAQVNASEEFGTIQSIASFTPPFSATAEVEGTVSNGHTFGFAVASFNASTGVLVYGNLNPTNCSHLGDCSDPSVCGTPANSAIPPNQCYYGMDAKTSQSGGQWKRGANLFGTPSVNVTYTLQISVDASGDARYSVSQGGQVLGQSSAQVGTGPFYIVIEQAEGAPVATPGPNQAYWMSVTLGAYSPPTTTATTSTAPAPTSSGFPVLYLILIVVVVVAFLLIILLAYMRRGGLRVTVLDSKGGSPIPRATVAADGPKNLSEYTDDKGLAKFGDVKDGDYSIKAAAAGYLPSMPAKVKVKGRTNYTVRLDRVPPTVQEGAGGMPPSEGPKVGTSPIPSVVAQAPPSLQPQPQAPPVQAPPSVQEAPPPTTPATVAAAPVPAAQQEPAEPEGWGGERIREIVKKFQEKGAISPETAMTAKELGLSRIFVRIMQRRRGRTRVFVEINGKFYLDQKALQEMGLG